MRLHHTTTVRALTGIMSAGLDPACSRGALQAVWLHCRQKTAWAFLHVAGRHGCRIQDVITITVNVPRSWLRRSRRGLWYCLRTIPADRITFVTTYGEISRSPVTEEVLV